MTAAEAGLVAVLICTDRFAPGARLRADQRGHGALPILAIPHPEEGITEEWQVEALTDLGERIVRVLEEPDRPESSQAKEPTMVEPEHFAVADEAEFNRLALDRGWSDGLPLVAPSHERVAALLASIGADPDAIVASLPPSGAPATLAALATNTIMAGCAPGDFPVVVAAVKALAHPRFHLDLIQVTTSPATPMIVVNGPVAGEIGLNGGTNALGPGNRANATIGRAVRLILQNIGGATPGTIDMATLGQPGKYTFCFAENESASPWEPLATGAGFSPGQSAVTVIAAGGICEIRDSESQSADDLIQTLANSTTMVGIVGPSGTAAIAGSVTLVLCPEHARILSAGGLGRAAVQQRVWEAARVPAEALSSANRAALSAARQLRGLTPHFESLPLTERPDDILIVVAGGPGRKSAFIPGWGLSRAVTCPINHNSDLLDAVPRPIEEPREFVEKS